MQAKPLLTESFVEREKTTVWSDNFWQENTKDQYFSLGVVVHSYSSALQVLLSKLHQVSRLSVKWKRKHENSKYKDTNKSHCIASSTWKWQLNRNTDIIRSTQFLLHCILFAVPYSGVSNVCHSDVLSVAEQFFPN